MAKKRNPREIPKGIPDSLIPLWLEGERVRFNGFWLNGSDRDRRIADWIDAQSNASEVMKFLIDRVISGGGLSLPSIPNNQGPDGIERALLEFDD